MKVYLWRKIITTKQIVKNCQSLLTSGLMNYSNAPERKSIWPLITWLELLPNTFCWFLPNLVPRFVEMLLRGKRDIKVSNYPISFQSLQLLRRKCSRNIFWPTFQFYLSLCNSSPHLNVSHHPDASFWHFQINILPVVFCSSLHAAAPLILLQTNTFSWLFHLMSNMRCFLGNWRLVNCF